MVTLNTNSDIVGFNNNLNNTPVVKSDDCFIVKIFKNAVSFFKDIISKFLKMDRKVSIGSDNSTTLKVANTAPAILCSEPPSQADTSAAKKSLEKEAKETRAIQEYEHNEEEYGQNEEVDDDHDLYEEEYDLYEEEYDQYEEVEEDYNPYEAAEGSYFNESPADSEDTLTSSTETNSSNDGFVLDADVNFPTEWSVTGISNSGAYSCYANAAVQTVFNHPLISQYFVFDPECKTSEYQTDFFFSQEAFSFLREWESAYKLYPFLEDREKDDYLTRFQKLLLNDYEININQSIFVAKIRKYFSEDFFQMLCNENSAFQSIEKKYQFMKKWFYEYSSGNTTTRINESKIKEMIAFTENNSDIRNDPTGIQDSRQIYEQIFDIIGVGFKVETTTTKINCHKLLCSKDYVDIVRVPFIEGELDLQELIDTLFEDKEVNDEKNPVKYESGNTSELWAHRREKTKITSAPPEMLLLQYLRFDETMQKDRRKVAVPSSLEINLKSAFGYDATYRISGFSVHQSSSRDSGHYYSYVYKENDGWYKCDDSFVTKVDAAKVPIEKAYLVMLAKA